MKNMQKESDFIFGLHPVLEAIKAGKQIDRLLVRDGLQGSLYHELMRAARENSISCQFVPSERLDLLTRKNHQGVIAWISLIEFQKISNILPSVYENGEDPLIVMLDSVSDVRNFGAIVRTAHSLGAHAIIIPEKGSARITADAIKTSAGALHSFPVCREKSLLRSAQYLKESGIKVICAAEKSGRNISGTTLTGPVVVVMGSEDKGISRELLAMADETVGIPMTGNIGSLNVSVAAGIILYEIVRQRSA
jgi:23S rRNA (guanosine2251-2'-O)-methyltransferase